MFLDLGSYVHEYSELKIWTEYANDLVYCANILYIEFIDFKLN